MVSLHNDQALSLVPTSVSRESNMCHTRIDPAGHVQIPDVS